MGSGKGCVVLYCESPLCLDFVGFFSRFELWCVDPMCSLSL